MSSTRQIPPQSFVSSYAPRVRTYANSLLTPVVPQTVLPPQVRTTKRGTTAINYAEEFDDDSIDDSDAQANPRRGTGLRTRPARGDGSINPTSEAADKAAASAQKLGKEIHNPVDVQGIWRDWMGKPKRVLPPAAAALQAVLPTTLVPIRIDLDIPPFRPEAALPTPAGAQNYGIDENLPAYRAPEPTSGFRLRDGFLWNLHEGLVTPDMFARTLVDELDMPASRKVGMVAELVGQIRGQLEEWSGVALHQAWQPAAEVQMNGTAEHGKSLATPLAPLSRETSDVTAMQASTPGATFLQPPQTNGQHTSGTSTPQPDAASSPALAVTARSIPPDETSPHLNLPDSHRCILNISLNLHNRLYTDSFEWNLLSPTGLAETFARQTCADLGLAGEWVPALTNAIYEATLRLKKDFLENNGSLAGVVGSGVNGWGEVENEACEFHGTAESALGVGAGWRFDEDALGMAWGPRVEVLSKEEIEKREGDRERQLRRARRETARFTTSYALPSQGSGLGNGYFDGGLTSSSSRGLAQAAAAAGADDDERMGRGERSKKKRRFRSLSPADGNGTPDAHAAGTTQLTEGERAYWHCSHCRVWGAAVWGVRDGPLGAKTLCHVCGTLWERDERRRLPPWNRGLFALEQNQAIPRPAQVSIQQQNARGPSGFLGAADTAPFSRGGAVATPPPAIARAPPVMMERDPTINPSSHMFTGASLLRGQTSSNINLSSQPPISASTMADIVNYAEPGEDLDWTLITEPRERKRLQNIINGRKYRERRLASEGIGGSGGNYRGAGGEGSEISQFRQKHDECGKGVLTCAIGWGYGKRGVPGSGMPPAALTANHMS